MEEKTKKEQNYGTNSYRYIPALVGGRCAVATFGRSQSPACPASSRHMCRLCHEFDDLRQDLTC